MFDADIRELEAEAVDYAVTCATEFCVNYDLEIVVQTFIGCSIVCGPCGALLVDSVPEAP